MRIVVTGAGGFSGTEIVSHLLSLGHKVVAIIGSTRGRLSKHLDGHENLQVIQADLSKPFNFPIAVDVVFHAAARSPGDGVSVDDMVRDNVQATRNLIAYANEVHVKLFVFFSSLSIHGDVKTKILDEQTPICSPDPYGLTKLLCEEMLKAQSFSMRSLAIRLPGLIGQGSDRNWLSRTLMAACTGKDIKIFNPDAPFNNAVHIEDLCHFVSGLLEKRWNGFDTVCLGAAGHLTVAEAANLLVKGAARGSKVVIENSKGTSFQISSERAELIYGYSPMNIKTMLQKFVLENSNLARAY